MRVCNLFFLSCPKETPTRKVLGKFSKEKNHPFIHFLIYFDQIIYPKPTLQRPLNPFSIRSLGPKMYMHKKYIITPSFQIRKL
jgi:hypothetical protein